MDRDRENNLVDPLDQRIDLIRYGDFSKNETFGKIELSGKSKYRALRLFIFGIPTILTSIYFLFFAAPRYESTATFIVRSQASATANEITSFFQTNNIVTSPDDSYVVHAYIDSRDILNDLIRENNFKKIISHFGYDFLWAPPGTFFKSTEERMYKYYRSLVKISFDNTTGITTVSTEAFNPLEAQQLGRAILEKSEVLLNQLNERAKRDAITAAVRQVEINEARTRQAQERVTDFRNREAMIDPTLNSSIVLQTIAGLSVQIAEQRAQLSELSKAQPNSPQIRSAQSRIEALQTQIIKERSQFGGTSNSLALQLAEYEGLILQREFAQRALAAALTSLESANIDALKRKTYLEPISQPSLPDYPQYPYRAMWIAAIAIINFATFFLLQSFMKDTLRHQTR